MKILPSEITSYTQYINRRKFMKSIFSASVVISTSNISYASHESDTNQYQKKTLKKDWE